MIDKKLLTDLFTNKVVAYDEITKEEYEEYVNAIELDFLVYRMKKKTDTQIAYGSDDNVLYQYIKIMKKDLEGDSLNTALLLLAEKRQEKMEKQVGCIYAYILVSVILSVLSIIFLIFS